MERPKEIVQYPQKWERCRDGQEAKQPLMSEGWYERFLSPSYCSLYRESNHGPGWATQKRVDRNRPSPLSYCSWLLERCRLSSGRFLKSCWCSVSVDGVGLEFRKVLCFQQLLQAEMTQELESSQKTFIHPSESTGRTSAEGTSPFHCDVSILWMPLWYFQSSVICMCYCVNC